MPFASLGVAPNGSCVLMMADLSPCGSHWVQLGSKCLRVCYCLPTFLLTNPRSRCARQSFLWNSSYIAVSLILYKDNNEWYSTLTSVLVCVCVSHSVMSNLFVTPWMVAHQAPLSMEFSRQEYWSCSHSLIQGIFPNQRSNLGLPHCRQILYIPTSNFDTHRPYTRLWRT